MKKVFALLAIMAFVVMGCSKDDLVSPDDPIIPPPDDTTTDNHQDTVRFIFKMDVSRLDGYVVTISSILLRQTEHQFLPWHFAPTVEFKPEFEIMFVGDTATNIIGYPMIVRPGGNAYWEPYGPENGYIMRFEPEFVEMDSVPKESVFEFVAIPCNP